MFPKRLSKIYDQSIELGEYHAQPKIAKVMALFEKKDTNPTKHL